MHNLGKCEQKRGKEERGREEEEERGGGVHGSKGEEEFSILKGQK